MTSATPDIQYVEFENIYLDQSNPRHEDHKKSQNEAVEYLCRNENVIQLARDIKQYGLNPLEVFALIPDENRSSKTAFVAAEGNRRICALKLLNDPDLAPKKYHSEFVQLSSGWEPISDIPARVFPDRESVRVWLLRIHGGEQGGIGRRRWNADQISRFTGDGKNLVARQVLDYAEEKGFITKEQRKGRLTTASRYLGNSIFRENLGIDVSNREKISRTRPSEEFDKLISKFTRDLVANDVVNSRNDKDDIIDYARKISNLEGVTNNRITPTALNEADAQLEGADTTKKRRKKPKAPKHLSTIRSEQEIVELLEALGVYKLQSLYYSICNTPLGSHTPLVAIGIWSFLESLTALIGRENTNLEAYFSNNALGNFGYQNKEKKKTLRDSIRRLQDGGNTSKHHATSATFDARQLANDMDTIADLIKRCVEKAIANKAK